MKRVHVSNSGEIRWLDEILSGRKVYEGRLATKIQEWDLDVGKQLIFYDDYEIRVEVTDLKFYPNFVEAYHNLKSKLVPSEGQKWSDEKIRSFYHFYSDKDVKKCGVVAIGVRLV